MARSCCPSTAEHSPDQQVFTPSRKEIGDWVRTLPSAEKDTIVERLIDSDDPLLSAEVRQRAIREISGGVQTDKSPARTAGEIYARADTLAAERKQKQAERREQEKDRRERAEVEARKKRLESLAGRENDLWARIDKLVVTKQPRRYDEAV
jgi:FtsZ-interacting cell division protein YlmF